MKNNIRKLDWKIDQVWEGSILASIAHAIMVAHYPNFSNEHSWDGVNYSVQDSAGARGTITFQNKCCVAAFRSETSGRINKKGFMEFFQNTPQELIDLAENEALQYLLDDVDGEVIPVITTAFWGKGNELFSEDSFDELLENGGHLLKTQAMDSDSAINVWKGYYDMSQAQVALLSAIYARKIANPEKVILISREELNMIGVDGVSLRESVVSFEEMNIKCRSSDLI
jgi:hypothetical protein